MKKTFSIKLLITLISSTTLSTMAYSAMNKPSNNIQLNPIKIEKLIRKTYIQIPFSNKFFQCLPTFIQQMKNKHFELDHAKPTFEQLEQLLVLVQKFQPNLKVIILSDCGLKKLPKVLTTFKNLEELSLESNPQLDFEELELLLGLVQEFQPNLKSINLSDCGLKKLPKVLTEFNNLKKLIVSKNPQIDDAALKEFLPWLYKK